MTKRKTKADTFDAALQLSTLDGLLELQQVVAHLKDRLDGIVDALAPAEPVEKKKAAPAVTLDDLRAAVRKAAGVYDLPTAIETIRGAVSRDINALDELEPAEYRAVLDALNELIEAEL